MPLWAQLLVALLPSILACGGLWGVITHYIDKKMAIKTAEDHMLLGLAHDRIFQLCKHYIAEGSVSVEDYRNLEYLYGPYKELGGNGTAKKLFEEVKQLHLEVNNDD